MYILFFNKMPAFKNLLGIRFKRWLVSECKGTDKNNNYLWLCGCDCGQEKIIKGYELTRGGSKSCGCYKKEEFLSRITTHGLCEKLPEYSIWLAIKQRCNNPNSKQYKDYGGREIKYVKNGKIILVNFWKIWVKNLIRKQQLRELTIQKVMNHQIVNGHLG